MWCHVRHLNCVGKNLGRITKKKDKKIAKGLKYNGIDLPMSKTDHNKIEVLNGININVFCYDLIMILL